MSRIKRYQNPELYERLSAEYVLGTLKGQTLIRFEKLMQERPYIRHSVEIWQERLSTIIATLPDEKPSPHVWQNIQQQIKHSSDQESEPKQTLFSRLFNSPRTWQAVSALLVLFLIIPAIGTKTTRSSIPMPSYVAVLENDGKTPMMVTLGHQSKQMVTVRMMQIPEVYPELNLQLWAVHNSQRQPVPVGVLRRDHKETHLKLTRPHWQKIEGAQTFAISFEPKDHPLSNGPTGQLIYKGKCLDFI